MPAQSGIRQPNGTGTQHGNKLEGYIGFMLRSQQLPLISIVVKFSLSLVAPQDGAAQTAAISAFAEALGREWGKAGHVWELCNRWTLAAKLPDNR